MRAASLVAFAACVACRVDVPVYSLHAWGDHPDSRRPDSETYSVIEYDTSQCRGDRSCRGRLIIDGCRAFGIEVTTPGRVRLQQPIMTCTGQSTPKHRVELEMKGQEHARYRRRAVTTWHATVRLLEEFSGPCDISIAGLDDRNRPVAVHERGSVVVVGNKPGLPECKFEVNEADATDAVQRGVATDEAASYAGHSRR